MDKVKILFFIAGMSPTPAEIEQANKLGHCAYRNASNYDNVTSVESCDYVAGLVPEMYSGFATIEPKQEKKIAEVKVKLPEKKESEEKKVVWSSGN